MGYMPDFFGVYDRLKSWEYLDFYARCYGFGPKERRRMTDSLLELVNLSDKRDSYVDVLSRGMKQRLCLARALIHDPRLLILDEPASGMDPRARAEMKGILRTLKDMGKTVLISSHILPELSEMCDSLTIIDHGRLVFSGSVEELGRHMSGNAPIRVRLAGDAGGDGGVRRFAHPPVSGRDRRGARGRQCAHRELRGERGGDHGPAQAARRGNPAGGLPSPAAQPGKGLYGGDAG